MATSKTQQAGVGLRPSEMVEGGGLLDDIEATVSTIRFALWDYGGRVPQAVPAIEMEMETVDGEKATQYWSAGNAKDWVPSSDGSKLIPIGRATGINLGSNAGILLTSIVNAGFPEDRIGDDIKVFEGMVVHLIRVPAPKRSGLVRTPRADGRAFEETILTVDKIIKLPWEKKAAGGATKAKTATGTLKDEGEGIEAKANAVVMEILGENENGIAKVKLAALVFQKLKDDPDRNEIVQIIYKDAFLKDGPWTYEKGIVSMQEVPF